MSKFALTKVVVVLGACSSACSHKLAQRPVTPPQPAAVHASMGRHIRNAVDAGEGDLAANRLRERMIKEPANLALRLELANHHRQRGHADLAMEHYRLILERDPANERATLALAQTLRERDHASDAAAVLSKFIESHPATSAELPGWLGLLQDEAGEQIKAESAHRLAVSLDSKSAKLHNNLGYNLLTQGRRDEALSEFQKALSLDSKLEIARNNLALALGKNGTPEERKEALLHWQAMSGPASAHNNLAVVMMEQGEYLEARRELETALGHAKGFLPAMRNLAILTEMDGRPAVLPSGKQPAKQKAVRQTRAPMRRLWDSLIGASPAPPAQPGTVARSKMKLQQGERTSQ